MDKPEGLAAKPKPKFAPKIPAVKKEPAAGAAAPPAPPAETAPKDAGHKNKSQGRGAGGRGGRGGSQNDGRGRGRGRDGAGRGQWTMPLGPLFFSAGATQNVATATSSAAPRPAALATSSGIPASVRAKVVGRPNEIIAAEDAASGRVLAPSAKALSPVTLPIGPKSGALRRALQQQPILAHPDDAEGLQHEAENALFLVQLPSDLNLRHLVDQQRGAAAGAASGAMDVDDGGHGASSGGSATRPSFRLGAKGHLGKMQLLKSGRVRMLVPTTTGELMEFDVDAGLMSSFYQDLLAVDKPPADAAAAAAAAPSSSSAAAAAEAPKKEAAAESEAAVAVLGNVTRKLVVTPPFAVLGEKRDKLAGAAYLADAMVAAKADAEEAALLAQGATTLGFSQYLERLNGGAGDITAGGAVGGGQPAKTR
eukprot:gene10542-7497_t